MALIPTLDRTPSPPPDLPAGNRSSPLVTLATIVVVIGALYFGAEIFVPLALAMLLSFALAPVVRLLRRLSIPNLPAVLTVVALAFLLILMFVWILALQAVDIADRLPTYRANIETKIDTLFQSPPGGRLFERASDMVRDLGRKIEEESEADEPPTPQASSIEVDEEQPPLPVEIHEPAPTPLQIISTVLGPLVSPLATAGIVVVFVIFMLLKREDLRDRFIRLAGSRDLPRTTQALDDAARRVGRYLLMQLVVNVTYAIPIGIGLWLIGIPNPILWGMLCGLLRFVPYIGPIVAAFFPLALSIAVDPGWTTLLMTGALFIVIELISNNFVEPWLYGASTGLSPVAVIAAAVFWTWLWGPIGLLLSTPLTVCLVVLGRHVPQMAFLDVLLGSEPVLSPAQYLYQRFLVGDPHEATERAEEYLRKHPLIEFYDDVAIPAIELAEEDRTSGRLSDKQLTRVTESALVLLDNLAEWEEPPAKADDDQAEGQHEPASEPLQSDLTDAPLILANVGAIVCAGARGQLDELPAAMLAQLLEHRGATAQLLSYKSLQSAALRDVDMENISTVLLSYMNHDSLAHARFLVRRLRRRFPSATIIVCFWRYPATDIEVRDPRTASGADLFATSLAEAMQAIAEKDTPAALVAAAPILPLAAGKVR